MLIAIHNRFFGLSGMYCSLQYLSLSTATVLTFLSPFATAIAGALLLHESLSIRELAAGGLLADPYVYPPRSLMPFN
jgi:drug/metabolite transporter (DMT)-like permease